MEGAIPSWVYEFAEGAGGDTGLGAFKICSGGAESPTTLPDTEAALLSFVTAFRNLVPARIEPINALLSPAPAATGAAIAAGGGGATGG